MDLDSIQSPYISGILDKFFDGVITPLVETARGCPFLCNFCNAGDNYFNRIHKFSDDYVKEELTYIAKKCSDTGGGHVTFADNNFGMIPRDALTVEVVNDLQQKYAWPKTMTVWTGKNSKKRVIDATRILGKSLGISMSVQSMDPDVLKNIKRDNINIEDYTAVAQELNNQGRPQHAELILPLLGETFQSHFEATLNLLDSQVSHIGCHTITMLFGTPYKDDEAFREKNGYVTKYRMVVKNFSTIEKTPVFDVEEVGIATKDMTFSEYIKARKFHYIIDLCLNSHNFDVMHRYLLQNKIKLSNWMQLLFEKINEMPDAVKNIILSFKKETIDKLWDSEEEMIAYFSKSENYKKLVDGERGNNVMFRHRVWMLSIEPELFVSSNMQVYFRYYLEKCT